MRAAVPSLPPDAPQRLGRYEILLPIASGGMATVYLARAAGAHGFSAEVAVKLTHAHLRETPAFAYELLEEAKLVSRIRHHNVVPVLDVGEDPRGIYLVMEYIEGDSLAGVFRKERAIPWPIAGRFVLDALAGLHAAHEMRDEQGELVGVVHRDFTPHNILVGIDGIARLADFGIAKAATRLGNTRSGIVKGKIAYMPPEQAKGEPLDRRCDVWAAGVVAWELFAGSRLYDEGDDFATLLKVATEAPPLLSSVVPDAPPALTEAIASALTMDRARRCPTAADLARSLGAALRASVGVADPSEAADWITRLVWPRVSERRLQVAEIRAHRERTSRETPAVRQEDEPAPVSESSIVVVPESTAAVPTPPRRVPEPTALLPTRMLPESETRFTDGVSVVAQRTAPAFRFRPVQAGAALAGLALVGLLAWVLAPKSPRAPESTEPSAAAAQAASPPAGANVAPPVASSTTFRLRLRSDAPLASLRVDGRDASVMRGAMDVTLDLGARDPGVAVAIDAISSDGRRAAILIAPDAGEARLDFPPAAAGARPSPAAHGATRAAPLSPNPYH